LDQTVLLLLVQSSVLGRSIESQQSLTAMKTTRHRTRFLWALWELAAGITAGSWYAWPSTHVGYELIGAAMLIPAVPAVPAGGGRGFPLDYDELERWTRVGYERGMRSRKGER
jgi:hypothetical protein